MSQNGSPFIIPFSVLGKYFFFDVNTNSVVKASKDLHDLLAVDIGTIDEIRVHANEKINAEIDELILEGYLKSNRISVIEHFATPYIDSYISNYLSRIVLQVTRGCNMRCRYCGYASDSGFDRNHGSEKMDWVTAKKAIDFLREHSELQDHVEVGFYGGEPFLNFKLIKEAVLYSEKVFAGKKLSFGVTTNGTVINDDIINFVNEHNISVCFSIDGPRKYHNKNRRYAHSGFGTFDDTINGFKRMVEGVDNYTTKISINSVIDPEENYHEYESFFNEEPMFEGIEITSNPIDSSLLSDDIVLSSDLQLNNELEKLNYYLDLLGERRTPTASNLNMVKEIYELNHSFDRKGELGYQGHHNGPCFPGYTNLLITVDGNILPCEKGSELATCMYIGTLDDGFNYESVSRMLNIGKLTEQSCVRCPIIRHCKMCAMDVNDLDKFDAEIKKVKCREQRNVFFNKLKKYVILNELGLLECVERLIIS